MAEREAKYLHAREKQAMKERSTPLKRKLPRPIACDEENIVSSNKSQANDPVIQIPGELPCSCQYFKSTLQEYLLEKEMYEMVQDDGVRFPVRANGVTQAPSSHRSLGSLVAVYTVVAVHSIHLYIVQSDDPQYVLRSKSSLPYYDPEELAAASNLLKEELVDLLETKGITKEDDSDLWTQAVDELIFLPQKTAYCSQTQVSLTRIIHPHHLIIAGVRGGNPYCIQCSPQRAQTTGSENRLNKMLALMLVLSDGQRCKESQQAGEEAANPHSRISKSCSAAY